MTGGEKERFCTLAASMMALPDASMMAELQQEELRRLIGKGVRRGGGRPFPAILGDDVGRAESLAVLQAEYERLFGPWEGERISLVESTYKAWTRDKTCGMVFAASTGLVMGDAALHMQALYRELALEIPESFVGMPDHLVLELEFLALLYRSGSEEQVRRFIRDHLDWIPELQAAVERADPHPFYREAVGIIRLFLQRESKKEGYDHGEKKIH